MVKLGYGFDWWTSGFRVQRSLSLDALHAMPLTANHHMPRAERKAYRPTVG